MNNNNYNEQIIKKSCASAIKSLKSRKLMVVFVVLFLCVTIFLVYNKLLNPPKLFRQYILNPIPASVTNIKANQLGASGGYKYVFRFDIERADLNLIIKSRPFREAKITGFPGGSIYFVFRVGSSYPEGHSFDIYRSKQHKPSWYTLESWEEPETCALVKEGKSSKGVETLDIQVLAYNAKLGQAFFIVYHRWGK